jgi:hypothetical protein
VFDFYVGHMGEIGKRKGETEVGSKGGGKSQGKGPPLQQLLGPSKPDLLKDVGFGLLGFFTKFSVVWSITRSQIWLCGAMSPASFCFLATGFLLGHHVCLLTNSREDFIVLLPNFSACLL